MANKKWQWSEQSKHGHLAMKSYEKNVFIAMQKSKGTMQKISVAENALPKKHFRQMRIPSKLHKSFSHNDGQNATFSAA